MTTAFVRPAWSVAEVIRGSGAEYSGPRTSDQKVAVLSYCFVRAFLPATPRYTSTGGR